MDEKTAATRSFLSACNGDLFVSNDSGEANHKTEEYQVTLYADATNDEYTSINESCAIIKEVGEQLPQASGEQKTAVAILRILARKKNLYVFPGTAEEKKYKHGTKYSEVNLKSKTPKEAKIDVEDPEGSFSVWLDKHVWWDKKIASMLPRQFTNILCLVAYVFRTRGHHYIEDKEDGFEDVYSDKWKKNRNARALPKGIWKFIATNGVHAILPARLDAFYTEAVTSAKCCRAFQIRYHAPAAGNAAIFALKAGILEMLDIHPRNGKKHAREIKLLDDAYYSCLNNRWKGSINAIYYGASPVRVRESQFSTLAAIVFGINSVEDEETTLAGSKSLERVAGNSSIATKMNRAFMTGTFMVLNSRETQQDLGKHILANVFSNDTESKAVD